MSSGKLLVSFWAPKQPLSLLPTSPLASWGWCVSPPSPYSQACPHSLRGFCHEGRGGFRPVGLGRVGKPPLARRQVFWLLLLLRRRPPFALDGACWPLFGATGGGAWGDGVVGPVRFRSLCVCVVSWWARARASCLRFVGGSRRVFLRVFVCAWVCGVGVLRVVLPLGVCLRASAFAVASSSVLALHPGLRCACFSAASASLVVCPVLRFLRLRRGVGLGWGLGAGWSGGGLGWGAWVWGLGGGVGGFGRGGGVGVRCGHVCTCAPPPLFCFLSLPSPVRVQSQSSDLSRCGLSCQRNLFFKGSRAGFSN